MRRCSRSPLTQTMISNAWALAGSGSGRSRRTSLTTSQPARLTRMVTSWPGWPWGNASTNWPSLPVVNGLAPGAVSSTPAMGAPCSRSRTTTPRSVVPAQAGAASTSSATTHQAPTVDGATFIADPDAHGGAMSSSWSLRLALVRHGRHVHRRPSGPKSYTTRPSRYRSAAIRERGSRLGAVRHQLGDDRAPGLWIERAGGAEVLRPLEPQDRAAGLVAVEAVGRTGL